MTGAARKALPWVLVVVALGGLCWALSGRLEALLLGLLGLLPAMRRARLEAEQRAERRGYVEAAAKQREVAAEQLDDLAAIDKRADAAARIRIALREAARRDRSGRIPTPEELDESDKGSR